MAWKVIYKEMVGKQGKLDVYTDGANVKLELRDYITNRKYMDLIIKYKKVKYTLMTEEEFAKLKELGRELYKNIVQEA